MFPILSGDQCDFPRLVLSMCKADYRHRSLICKHHLWTSLQYKNVKEKARIQFLGKKRALLGKLTSIS